MKDNPPELKVEDSRQKGAGLLLHFSSISV